jgi:hypothetical protein
MQEDIQKNFTPYHFETQNSSKTILSDAEKNIKNGEGFISLSKIAKEKKYAQEYLGLLARRGDIGSIRIRKRWYTTWAWFEEFLENGQKKKIESVCEIKVSQPAMIKELTAVETSSSLADKLSGKSERVAVIVKTRRVAIRQPEKVSVRNFVSRKVMQPILRGESRLQNVSAEKRNRYAVPFQKIRLKKKADIFSPNIAVEEKMIAPIFSRFVLAMSFAVMIVLLAVSGYFVWSGGLLVRGQVAGASDERSAGFSGITSGGEYVLTSAGDKMKESLSVSRVMVEAAKEKVSQENLVN